MSEVYWKGLYHLGNIKGNIGKGRAEFQVPMSTYTFQVLYCHQINLLFIIFASDIENYIVHLLLRSHIQTLARINYISLQLTTRAAYYLFIQYFPVFLHLQRQGSSRVSYSGLPTRYSVDIISNDIPFVNSFPLFIPTLSFKLQIRNQQCVTTVPQISAG